MKNKIINFIIAAVVSAAALVILFASSWISRNYGVSITELIYTAANNLAGANNSTVERAFKECLPGFFALYLVILAVIWGLYKNKVPFGLRVTVGKKKKTVYIHKYFGIVASFVLLVLCFEYSDKKLSIVDFAKKNLQKTTIYEDYYVHPDSVNIVNDGEKRNLIYIYLESMETTYASVEDGGSQDVNYIPYLTQLAREEANFSETDGIGGFHAVSGGLWTSGALFTTSAAIPYSFPVAANAMKQHENLSEGTVALQDILEDEGYNQYFLCGSDAAFGSRSALFTIHGEMTIYDLMTARAEGYIPEDYFVWWGYEDFRLYEIAKDKILEAASLDQPFNFTMLTVDTHFTDGYICEYCGDEYDSVAANVISCADRQIIAFLEWCKDQEFYENTSIVITGDHPRMDTALVKKVDDYDRLVYACFVNSGAEDYNRNRIYTQLDMFPTILHTLGYDIEGNRLGLGVNLFSEEKTLAEEFGFDWLYSELEKGSDYYLENFS